MGKAIGIIFGVLLIILVALVALVKFNVFELGYKVGDMIGYDTPVVSIILPEKPETEEAEYQFESVEEAINNLKITEEMLKESREHVDILNEEVDRLNLEIDRLKEFEANQLQFEKDKAEFDKYIITSFNKKDFLVWFEKTFPENATSMYTTIGTKWAQDETSKSISSMYEEMKPKEAADILTEMTETNLDEVVAIMKGLSKKQAGSILGSMEPSIASKITTYMYQK